jgi:hypothetical protein
MIECYKMSLEISLSLHEIISFVLAHFGGLDTEPQGNFVTFHS